MGSCAASDLGLHCLPMSHKKDARLIYINLNSCLLTLYRLHMGSYEASDLGLHCLPMSHKKDARPICSLTLTVAC